MPSETVSKYPPFFSRDGRLPEGCGLEWCEPVVLKGGGDQHAGVSVEPAKFAIVDVAEKVDVGSGRVLQGLPERSGPDDNQFEIGAFREHTENSIEVLVRQET